MKSIILNAMRTPDGTVLISRNRHDYVTHTDENGKTYMLDGGLDYIRSSAHGDETYMILDDSEPFDLKRWVVVWGTYGKDGTQPLTYKPVALMDTLHIKAVLKDCFPKDQIRKVMEDELLMRGEK